MIMKSLITILLAFVCLQTMAQITPAGKPPRSTSIETQKKASEMIKQEAAKRDALMNAKLEVVYLSLNQVVTYCRMSCEINNYFKEKKFLLYAGSKGKIIDANSFKLISNIYPQERYEFQTTKPILYKDLVNQNISFNIDLIKSYDQFQSYQNLNFAFRFSDGTVIYADVPGTSSYTTTTENKGEVHVSRYLRSNQFKDPSK